MKCDPLEPVQLLSRQVGVRRIGTLIQTGYPAEILLESFRPSIFEQRIQ